MEVEAKFAVPDRDTMMRMRRIVRLGDFVPGEGTTDRIHDRYLDTPLRLLYQHGYTCRFRSRNGSRLVTIKGLGGVEDAVHRRFESEVEVPDEASFDPNTWPEWEGRELVLSLIGEERLVELFEVGQERHARELRYGGRLVAVLCFDDGQIRAAGRERPFLMLEIELADAGTMDDLKTVVRHLTETWSLVPEPHSKFELGLAVLAEGLPQSGRDSGRVSAAERAQLLYIADHAQDKRLRDRAELVLGWDKGMPVRLLCAEIGLSRSWAYELLGRFRDERMAVFPREVVEAASPEPAKSLRMDVVPEDATVEVSMSALPTLPQTVTVAELCERFQVDLAHARRVADNALALFDTTSSIHKVESERRRLLEIMGMLHNVGLETDPDGHHVAGRDIVLAHPVSELSEVEQRMVAAAVYLHRKRFRRKRLKTEVVQSLPPGMRSDALALAALIRIADGLDYSQSQSTVLDEISVSSTAIRVSVSGPSAGIDAGRAQAKSDLWEHLYDVPYLFSAPDLPPAQESPAAEPQSALPVSAAKLETPGILHDDPMSEAGRKVLCFHFLRMLEHESGTRAGEDIEELHDMRVATRRMRAAFGVFDSHFKARAIRPYVAGLRRTARALGAVRDLDVFMQKAQAYLETLPPGHDHDLDPLLADWQSQREEARQRMNAYLDSDKYQDFVLAFQLFLETPGAGARRFEGLPPKPSCVNHVVPQLIYTRWAEVQAFGPLLASAPVSVLHALRIECKRLRYTLEFFREVLGPEAEQVIEEVVCLQDHLGNLNDADVANALLSDFLFGSRSGGPSERMIAPGVVAYLAVKQRELQELIETFPQAWERFNRPEVRTCLAAAVAVL